MLSLFPEAGDIVNFPEERGLRAPRLAIGADSCLYPKSQNPFEDSDTAPVEVTQ
jgi:hypothetical protein